MLFLPKSKEKIWKMKKKLTFVECSSDLTDEILFISTKSMHKLLVAVFDFDKLLVHFGNFRI